MSGTFDVQAAIRDSIKTEKDAMDFYKYGAEKMAEEKARKVFELLAAEERQHAKMFYNVYKGGDLPAFDEYIAAEPDTESDWWRLLQQAILSGFDERKALELAIEQEEKLEIALRETAAKVEDAEIRHIYLANANSTHHHLEVVEEEYKGMFGMS